MRAVFLDRDGVVNDCLVIDGKPFPPNSIETFQISQHAVEACQRLKDAGFALVIVTNQPDVGRGTLSVELLDEMHTIVRQKLPVDAIYTCTHGSDGECDCRKPKPGMLVTASQDLDIELRGSFMVGDRWKDIDCGHAAGCTTILIDHNYSEELHQAPNAVVKDIGEAADWILEQSQSFGETR